MCDVYNPVFGKPGREPCGDQEVCDDADDDDDAGPLLHLQMTGNGNTISGLFIPTSHDLHEYYLLSVCVALKVNVLEKKHLWSTVYHLYAGRYTSSPPFSLSHDAVNLIEIHIQ